MSRRAKHGLSPRRAALILKEADSGCAYSETAVGDWMRARIKAGVKFTDNYDVARSALAFVNEHGSLSARLALNNGNSDLTMPNGDEPKTPHERDDDFDRRIGAAVMLCYRTFGKISLGKER